MNDPFCVLQKKVLSFVPNRTVLLNQTFGQSLQSESYESFKLIEKSILRASYGTQIKRDFGAEPYQWNFAKDPQKAKNVVNAKVAKTSNGALKRFFEPGMAVQKCSLYYRVVSLG